jgi:hypothetical protein
MVDHPRELIGQVPGEMIAVDADVLVREASTPGRFQDLAHGTPRRSSPRPPTVPRATLCISRTRELHAGC